MASLGDSGFFYEPEQMGPVPLHIGSSSLGSNNSAVGHHLFQQGVCKRGLKSKWNNR